MVKISNWDWKLDIILVVIVCISLFILSTVILFMHKLWVLGSIIALLGLITFLITVLNAKWPESIIFDEEKIIVYRFGKERNRISLQNVKEVYKEEITVYRHRFYCYYYFSDGCDRFLSDKNGNEHFVVFKCARNKEYIFSRFTNLPIKELKRET